MHEDRAEERAANPTPHRSDVVSGATKSTTSLVLEPPTMVVLSISSIGQNSMVKNIRQTRALGSPVVHQG